jgi:F-type H+-transporting ATPase subunit epsilon
VARSSFPVEVLTPEGQVWEGEVEMVSTRTLTGSIGVLANHAPLMAMLEPTELRLYKSGSDNPGAGGDVERFAQGEGYLQVVDNSALLIVEDAIRPEDIDRSALESRVKEAEQARDSADEDSEERRRAERDIARAQAFLEIDSGS